MDNLAQVVLAELLGGDKKLIPAGQYKVCGEYRIKLDAFVKKGEDTESTPTVQIPYKMVLALLLEKAGATRKNLLSMIENCMQEAVLNGESIKEKLEGKFKDLDGAMERISGLAKKLPKVPRSGITKVIGNIEIFDEKEQKTN